MNFWRFMRKFNFILVFVLILSSDLLADDYQIKSDDVRVDSSGFSGSLSSSDDTVQKALNTIDGLPISGFPNDCITFIINSNGSVIQAGASGHKVVPWACTVTGWEITSSSSGSAVVDIKRSTYANYSTFSSIAGSEKPTLATATKNKDLSLTTWTTAIAAGDRIQASVDSANITGVVVLTIYLTKI